MEPMPWIFWAAAVLVVGGVALVAVFAIAGRIAAWRRRDFTA